MLIGLTGRNASGKGEVAKYLEKRSFYFHSLSDVIREEILRRGHAMTRELLIETGNELRRTHGPAVLAQRILAGVEPDKNYVIDSIRNPSEVETLRRAGHFKLLRVDAPVELRFERLRARAREGDPLHFERFVELEEREVVGDENSQNLRAVEGLADYTVVNDGEFEKLHVQIDTLLQEIVRQITRPGWDQYFMDIAKVVASRSNCVRRKVAAIIVRDKRVVSTGYNGTPRGTRNCNEGGCPRCNGRAVSGTALDECLCSHGEENAIVQASYHGVSVKDATIYTTFAPCLMCAKMIINSGITEVVFNVEYPLNDSSFHLFSQAGVLVRKLKVS